MSTTNSCSIALRMFLFANQGLETSSQKLRDVWFWLAEGRVITLECHNVENTNYREAKQIVRHRWHRLEQLQLQEVERNAFHTVAYFINCISTFNFPSTLRLTLNMNFIKYLQECKTNVCVVYCTTVTPFSKKAFPSVKCILLGLLCVYKLVIEDISLLYFRYCMTI